MGACPTTAQKFRQEIRAVLVPPCSRFRVGEDFGLCQGKWKPAILFSGQRCASSNATQSSTREARSKINGTAYSLADILHRRFTTVPF